MFRKNSRNEDRIKTKHKESKIEESENQDPKKNVDFGRNT